MSVDLDELLERVTDEQSFIEFIVALAADFPGGGALDGRIVSDWENGSVDTFLDAAAAWAVATSRNAQREVWIPNAWQRCAAILLAGKFYE